MHIVEQQQEGIIIDGYSQNAISINGQQHKTNLNILPKVGVSTWSVADNGALTLADCRCFDTPETELILIGHASPTTQLLSDEIRLHFARQAVGIEVMDIGAACRSYNILASEGRLVAAGFIF